MLRALFAGYWKRRYAWLFCTLLLTLGGHGPIAALLPDLNLMQALLAINLLAAIGGASGRRGLWLLVWIAAGFFTFRLLEYIFDLPSLLPVSEGLWVLVCTSAAVGSAQYAMRRGTVDAERIFAALDAYLLAGVIFGVVYWMTDRVWLDSFAGELPLSRALYFSFVTIATLGYGDIVPTSETSEGLAVLEAVGGQLYLVVLVARLVALYPRTDDALEARRRAS